MIFFKPKQDDDPRTPRDHIGALGDFWRYIQEDKPHKWASAALALTIVGLIFYFIWRALVPPPPEPTIIYVESWPANRSQADVERDWKQRAIEANEQNALRRRQFQKAADALGIDYQEPPQDKAAPVTAPAATAPARTAPERP